MDGNAEVISNLTRSDYYNSLGNSTKSSQALKRVKNYSASKTEELCKVIRKKVTEENYRENQESRQDKIPRKCKKLFKKGANPEVLMKLRKSLMGQAKYYNSYIQHFLPALKREIAKSKELNLIERTKIEQIIMKLITSDAVYKNSNENYSSTEMNKRSINGASNILNCTAKNLELSNTREEINPKRWENSPNLRDDSQFNFGERLSKTMDNLEPEINTSEIDSSGSVDGGVNSPGLSEESLESLVSNGRSSVGLILSSAEEDSSLQKEENKNQMKLERTAKEELQVQKNKKPGNEASPVQYPEKKRSMEDTTMQELLMNKRKGKDALSERQLSSREFYATFIANCALLAIWCFVGAVVRKSRILCLGWYVMTVALAIAAAWYLSPSPSSKLACTNSIPVINNEKSLRIFNTNFYC
ncbi:hypothetical protein GOY07_03540 [Wolbachia endosymbiont of Litomosoides sigmodontis]|nr:hypothetical protein GOY07_03540 [Wolbachia endosymbiont of Litomosoides sigmodontis]